MRAIVSVLLVSCIIGCNVPPAPEQAATFTPSGRGFPGGGGGLDCFKNCSTNSDCAPPRGGLADEKCVAGKCRVDPSYTFCDNQSFHWMRNAGGDVEDCAPYACDGDWGVCRQSCRDTNDCAIGFVCDSTSYHCELAGPGGPWDTYSPTQFPPLRERGWTTSSCHPACGSDSDCGAGQMCHGGECMINVPHCSDDELSMVTWWSSYSCGPSYRCDLVKMSCHGSCVTSNDCAPGYYCNADQECQGG